MKPISLGNQSGQIVLVALVLLTVMLLLLTTLVTATAAQIASHRGSVSKEQALHIAEAGLEMAVWKLNNQPNYSGENNTSFGAGTYSIAIATVSPIQKTITVNSYVPNNLNPVAHKTITITVSTTHSSSAAFYYGLQVGSGGLVMNNGSAVHGNVFSAGNISGSGTIDNDVIVSGNGHSIGSVYVTGNVRAYSCLSPASVNNLTYITGGTHTCLVRGTTAVQSSEIQEQPLPIPQSQIDDWKEAAEASSVSMGNLIIASNQPLGPKKIVGNLTVNNGVTLTLTGTVYVTGDITLQNNATVRLSSSYGSAGGVLLTDGKIVINNGNTFTGSGTEGSYVMLLSTSSNALAIDVQNNAQNVVLYAINGGITIHNNVSVMEAAGKSITLQNNAQIQYSLGTVNIYFSGGPGGSWQFIPGSYSINQ